MLRTFAPKNENYALVMIKASRPSIMDGPPSSGISMLGVTPFYALDYHSTASSYLQIFSLKNFYSHPLGKFLNSPNTLNTAQQNSVPIRNVAFLQRNSLSILKRQNPLTAFSDGIALLKNPI